MWTAKSAKIGNFNILFCVYLHKIRFDFCSTFVSRDINRWRANLFICFCLLLLQFTRQMHTYSALKYISRFMHHKSALNFFHTNDASRGLYVNSVFMWQLMYKCLQICAGIWVKIYVHKSTYLYGEKNSCVCYSPCEWGKIAFSQVQGPH